MITLRRALLTTLALWAASAAPAHAQSECTVTSTYGGRWTRVELNCDESEGSRPRVAVVKSDALRTCPLLAGDRVAVTYLNNDPTRQPTVTGIIQRGNGGPSSGDWCGRGYAPSPFAAPCLVEEVPPIKERTPTAGAGWVRTSVGTAFRDVDDNSAANVGPSACPPAMLQPGVYRIYAQRSVRRSTWRPCATDPASLCEESVTELERFEGGIYVDGTLEPVKSVTDVRPLLRGWSGPFLAAEPAVAAGPWLQTGPIRMGGSGVGVPWLRTVELGMGGHGLGVPWLLTRPIRMGGGGS